MFNLSVRSWPQQNPGKTTSRSRRALVVEQTLAPSSKKETSPCPNPAWILRMFIYAEYAYIWMSPSVLLRSFYFCFGERFQHQVHHHPVRHLTTATPYKAHRQAGRCYATPQAGPRTGLRLPLPWQRWRRKPRTRPRPSAPRSARCRPPRGRPG